MPNEFDLPKAYNPQEHEAKWSEFWEKEKLFVADASSKKPAYTIVMPPPNVTGVLHMGHALVSTLQDILIRWKRMSGFETLWVPGTDHAGIATQTVVERHLLATVNKRRIDYPREEFLQLVWQWKEKHEKTILEQLKKMGCSCDWSRLRFTMDEGCNKAVRTMFKKLFDAKLITRGNYLVNWDPVTKTALADDEVEYEERQTSLWYFKFPLADGSEHVCIATTRPETMLGDVAVAVSNKDPRYKHLVGKMIRHPITDKEIPIIADSFVDPEFGTGMVKITPAHDPTDHQIALHHNLPMINVYTPDGMINENGGRFEGMSKEKAREAIVKEMQAKKLVETIQKYHHRVGVSYRSKAIIEPYLSKQWFVKMAPFIAPLKEAVTEGKVKIVPPSWEHTYFHWVDNLRDWCISRQLWWGHRIPVWYNQDNPEEMICYDGEGEPPETKNGNWVQDPDVLDTWFSSALWPFSTLGWPDATPDLKKFYPNAVLVTGHDILFFWVARMILMGEYALGKPPFPETFLHGLIYGKSYWRKNETGGIAYVTGEEKSRYDLGLALPPDVHSKWEKLSKSKGNVIDPLEMIELYGTDAVRMSLCASANQTPQIDLDRRRFEEFKNFTNKVWNGARFALMHLSDLTAEELEEGLVESELCLEDRWILSAMNRINKNVNLSLANYSFDQAAEGAYNFFWNEFCANFLEIAKPILYGKTGTEAMRKIKQKLLVIVLTNALRLMHPMTPFITEELFQRLKSHFSLKMPNTADPYTRATIQALQATACMVAPYPQVVREQDIDETIEHGFQLVEKIVYTVRNIRGEMKIPPQIAVELIIVGHDEHLERNLKMVEALVKLSKVEIHATVPPLRGFSATGVVGALTLIIPLPKELAEIEKQRLEKERDKLVKAIEGLRTLFANEEFCQKASPTVIENQKNTLHRSETELEAIQHKLFTFNE